MFKIKGSVICAKTSFLLVCQWGVDPPHWSQWVGPDYTTKSNFKGCKISSIEIVHRIVLLRDTLNTMKQRTVWLVCISDMNEYINAVIQVKTFQKI